MSAIKQFVGTFRGSKDNNSAVPQRNARKSSKKALKGLKVSLDCDRSIRKGIGVHSLSHLKERAKTKFDVRKI